MIRKLLLILALFGAASCVRNTPQHGAGAPPSCGAAEVGEVFELGGVKTLISRNHYDRETFWTIHSKPRWDAAKSRLDPEGLFGALDECFAPYHYRE